MNKNIQKRLTKIAQDLKKLASLEGPVVFKAESIKDRYSKSGSTILVIESNERKDKPDKYYLEEYLNGTYSGGWHALSIEQTENRLRRAMYKNYRYEGFKYNIKVNKINFPKEYLDELYRTRGVDL